MEKEANMPAVSKKQRAFMGAELEKKKKGLPTATKMTMAQMEDFASTPEKGLREKAAPKGIARNIRPARIPKKRIWRHKK